MYLWISFTFLILLSEAIANRIDKGPQTFQSTSPTQQYKEVILYLTPSQIRAYEQQQMKNARNQVKPIDESETQDELKNSYQAPADNQKTQSIENHSYQYQRYGLPINQNFYVHSANIKQSVHNSAPRRFYPNIESLTNDESTHLSPQKGFKLVPYQYKPENLQKHGMLGKLIFEDQILNFQEQQDQKSDLDKQYRDVHNAASYNINNYDISNIIKTIEMEKLLSRAKIEEIAKSPPVVIGNEYTIKKYSRPIDIIKTVNVPVPVLVPVPEPYEVKVPQPYPFPVEVIKPFAVPIVKTEKVEVEKPVPVEIEKRVPVPVEKKVYVDVLKPYSVERMVPVEVNKEVPYEVPVYKPEKLTILRHVWRH